MTTATLPSIVTADYEINYHGTLIPLSTLTSDKLYALFESGSGSGDQSYWCSFRSTYGIYRNVKSSYGKALERVGSFDEVNGTDGKSFTGEIDGKPLKMDGFSVDDIFMVIFKKEK